RAEGQEAAERWRGGSPCRARPRGGHAQSPLGRRAGLVPAGAGARTGVTTVARAVIADTAVLAPDPIIRPATRVWPFAQVRAGAVVIPGLEIGRYAMIGAGAVVTRDVPAHALVVGNPARRIGWICVCGAERMERGPRGDEDLRCARCAANTSVARAANARKEGTRA